MSANVAVDATEGETSSGKKETEECAVCVQPMALAMRLPDCGHTFCFLCIKGVAMRQGLCPLCRRPIAVEIFRRPKMGDAVVDPPISLQAVRECGVGLASEEEDEVAGSSQPQSNVEPGFQWFYEARGGGWWRYDSRHEMELERGFAGGGGRDRMQMLIAGYSYVIDFDRMCQYRLGATGDAAGADAAARPPVRGSRAILRIPRDTLSTGDVRGIAGVTL